MYTKQAEREPGPRESVFHHSHLIMDLMNNFFVLGFRSQPYCCCCRCVFWLDWNERERSMFILFRNNRRKIKTLFHKYAYLFREKYGKERSEISRCKDMVLGITGAGWFSGGSPSQNGLLTWRKRFSIILSFKYWETWRTEQCDATHKHAPLIFHPSNADSSRDSSDNSATLGVIVFC